jgi:hypothetical protein
MKLKVAGQQEPERDDANDGQAGEPEARDMQVAGWQRHTAMKGEGGRPRSHGQRFGGQGGEATAHGKQVGGRQTESGVTEEGWEEIALMLLLLLLLMLTLRLHGGSTRQASGGVATAHGGQEGRGRATDRRVMAKEGSRQHTAGKWGGGNGTRRPRVPLLASGFTSSSEKGHCTRAVMRAT